MVKSNRPGAGDRGSVSSNPQDSTAEKALRSLDASLSPNMSRSFDEQTVLHIRDHVLPVAVEEKNRRVVAACEDVLKEHGMAVPNVVSGRWEPSDVPRNEIMVREMFAHRMPEYGYEVIKSREAFPDWLLRDAEGNYVFAEVEHRSSMFRRHDDTLCDLVVCWEHDFRGVRLPVLELFSGRTYAPTENAPKGDRSEAFAGPTARGAERSMKEEAVEERQRKVLAVYGELRPSTTKTDAVRLTAQRTRYSEAMVWRLVRTEGVA